MQPPCDIEVADSVVFRGFKGTTTRAVLSGNDLKPTFDVIPQVDCAKIFSPSLDDRKSVARVVGKVLREVGCLYAVNHGISEELQANVYRVMKEFFALPLEEKMVVHNSKSPCQMGYQYILEGRADDVTRGDFREAFKMVFDPRDREALMAGSSCPPSNINLWPSAPLDFCKYLYEYNDGILEFSKRFIRVVALALEVEETYFDNMISPISGLSPLHYPPNTGIPKPPGRSVHTDYSWFTVVNQLTSTTSLEVLNANGHFIGVPPIPNTLVLNVGDFLERATNHVFSSTIHRVIHLADVDRYSLAYFFDADPNAMIDIVETCLSEEHPRKYESIRAGLWQKKLLMWPKKIQCSSLEDNHTA